MQYFIYSPSSPHPPLPAFLVPKNRAYAKSGWMNGRSHKKEERELLVLMGWEPHAAPYNKRGNGEVKHPTGS